jgi:hypothetical protein
MDQHRVEFVFVYDEARSFAKVCIFLKLMGLVFYTSTLPTCSVNTVNICMLVAMLGSLVNSARYEYAHFKKYGQVFSIYEFEMWKNSHWPRSRLFFSIVEILIKVACFIETYPPRFELYNACCVGQSVLKIHTLVLSLLYTLFGILYASVFIPLYCCRGNSNIVANTQHLNATVVDIQSECCICLDKTSQPWKILPCGHAFHQTCILNWIKYHQTCPVCRFVLTPHVTA